MAKREILTAAQWELRLERLQRLSASERREYERKRPAELSVEDLRDETLSAIRSAGLSAEEVHARCGPHPATLQAWEERRVRAPRMQTIRAALRTVGMDIGVVRRNSRG